MEEAFWDSSDDLMAAVFSVLHDILCGWECIRGDRGDLKNCTDTDSGSR